jgi:hypothetical protein
MLDRMILDATRFRGGRAKPFFSPHMKGYDFQKLYRASPMIFYNVV